MNGEGTLLAIAYSRSGDEELRRVQALTVIFETTPNAVIRDACGFFLSHQVGTPGCRQAGAPRQDRQDHAGGRPGQACLACGMADPPLSMTCTLGRDHRVGGASGCPACLRLMAACAARPCSAARPGRAREGTL